MNKKLPGDYVSARFAESSAVIILLTQHHHLHLAGPTGS